MANANTTKDGTPKVCPYKIANVAAISELTDVACYGSACMLYRADWVNDDGSIGACGRVANMKELCNRLSLLRESIERR